MSKKLFALMMFSVFSFGSIAQAIVVEPYYTHYISGEDGAGNEMSGNEIGLRLGYDIATFAFGLDYVATGKSEYDDSAGELTPSGYGVYAAFDFPILVRAYASYMINYEYKVNSGKYLGNGTKIGIQYTGLPFVAIGLETVKYSFDEFETSSGAKSDVDSSNEYTGLSISVPLEF